MEAVFPGKLAVGEVNHGYRKFRISEPQPDFTAFQCMPAVACYQDSTTRYDAIERSVVLMIINGTTGCTGTLINNTANDGNPYLLTASHCLNNQFLSLIRISNERAFTTEDMLIAIKINNNAELAMGLIVCLISIIIH